VAEERRHPWVAKETSASFKTTELWAALLGVAAIIVTYYEAQDNSLDLFRTCLLATLLGMAYIVSRGMAKSGSRPERHVYDDDPRTRL
jgi:hypothetical protein